MEEKKLVICDSDVLIEFLDKANKTIENKLVDLGRGNLCISSVSHSEIIFGSWNKTHQKKLTKGLESFTLIEINQSIDFIHRQLIGQYALSHRLSIQDALVAATAIGVDCALFTLNKRDFKFIKGLQLI